MINGLGRVASVLCGELDKHVLGASRAQRYADDCFGSVRKKFLSNMVLNPPTVFHIHESADPCVVGEVFLR